MTTIAALSAPLPGEGSRDGEALLALERATQDCPLALATLMAEASDAVPGVVLVARDDVTASGEGGSIVGMASARLLGDEAHVVRLAVDATHRRRGTGRALLDGLIGWAARSGAPALLLEVRAGNAGALALYAAAGFAIEGRRPRYYPDGEDALLLRRVTLVADAPAVRAVADTRRG